MGKKYIYFILAIVIFFNLFFTKGILEEGFPNGGDTIGHYDLVVNTIDVIKIFFNTGELRLWNPDYYFGFPMFFFYAPLPYVFLASLSLVTTIDALLLLKISMVLLFSFFPLVMYIAARLMELDEKFSLCIAFFSTSLSSATVFGMEYYAFFATGLFSQLCAAIFFPFAFAFSYRYFVIKKGTAFLPVLFLFLTFNSHILVGFIAVLSVFFLCFMGFLLFEDRKILLKKAGIVFLFFFLSISFFVVPYVLNQDYFGNITSDLQKKEQGYGFVQTLTLLLDGKLLDYSFSFSRLPVLTVLVFPGIFISFLWKEFLEKYRILSLFLFITFLFSLTALAGKTSFPLLDKIPMLANIQTFRFIFLFHFVSLFYIGMTLWWGWTVSEHWKKQYLLFLLLLLLALPIIYERMQTFREFSITLDLSQDSEYWQIINTLKENSSDMRMYISSSTGLFDRPQQLQALPLLTGNPIFVSASIGAHDSLSAYYAELPVSSELADLFAVDFWIDGKRNNLTLSTTQEATGYFSVVSVPFAVPVPARDARELIVAWLFSDASIAGHYLEIETKRSILLMDIKEKDNFLAFTESGTDFAHHISGQILFDNAPTITVQSDGASFETSSYDYFQEYASSHSIRRCGEIVEEHHARGYSTATVSVFEEDCFVLFKMSYHPEWKAFVDGNQEQLRMLSPAFMGVTIPLGVHDVVFSYDVFWWRIMLGILGIVSLVGLYALKT